MRSMFLFILFWSLFITCANPWVSSQELTIQERIQARSFPSIFMAWALATNLPDLSKTENIAKHDLAFMGTDAFKLQWNHASYGLAEAFTPESIHKAREIREQLVSENPNLILLLEIRYRDAWNGFIPDDHPWWMRDENGQRKKGWEEGNFFILDYKNPEYRLHVAKRAKAAMESGAVDGIMLDWWQDDEDRLALIQTIRQAIGEEALIIANANDRQIPQTAPYINGLFMECWRSRTADDWQRIGDTLRWADANLREPRINCLETWYEKSRNDLDRMRATTCLVMTYSDGYALFSDPNDLPTGDHKHDWYTFWNEDMGKPTEKGVIAEDGFARREFEKGTVVYNPMGKKEHVVEFEENRRSAASGKVGKMFTVKSLDGDFFLFEKKMD